MAPLVQHQPTIFARFLFPDNEVYALYTFTTHVQFFGVSMRWSFKGPFQNYGQRKTARAKILYCYGFPACTLHVSRIFFLRDRYGQLLLGKKRPPHLAPAVSKDKVCPASRRQKSSSSTYTHEACLMTKNTSTMCSLSLVLYRRAEGGGGRERENYYLCTRLQSLHIVPMAHDSAVGRLSYSCILSPSLVFICTFLHHHLLPLLATCGLCLACMSLTVDSRRRPWIFPLPSLCFRTCPKGNSLLKPLPERDEVPHREKIFITLHPGWPPSRPLRIPPP